MTVRLTELRPDELSDVEVTFWRDAADDRHLFDILVVRYAGAYRHGSEGKPDARHVFARGRHGLAVYRPMAVLIDMSELEYEWGDRLEQVLDIGADTYVDAPFPMALLVGPKCAPAIATLLHEVEHGEEITSVEWTSTTSTRPGPT